MKYFFILFISQSFASSKISENLMKFFKTAGMSSNATSSGCYKDQTAGYYTGGSLIARNGIKNTQLATLQMPGFRAGCGGIDLWMGGFSHISSEHIVEMLRNIGSSAASYAFMLAIQTVSPQIYNIMNELNAIATQINQTNINSCEAAATMLGGIWPKSDQSSKHLCQSMGSQFGAFSDWSAARQGCGAKGDREKILNRRGEDARYKDMFAGEFNLSWKAIQSNAFLNADQDLAHLFMTLVGSIIVRKKEDDFEVTILPGYSDRDDVLSGLLTGGDTPIYTCDTQHCLNPSLKHTTLTQGLLKKTQEVLESLVTKIYEDTPLNSEEKDFLNSTRLPVYKMLNVMTAYRRGNSPLDIHHYGELIALDILYKYVLEVIDLVHESVTQLKSVQVDEAHMEQFLKHLKQARERITQRRQSSYQQMDSALSFIQATQLIEKQLHAQLSYMTNNDL